MVSPLDQPPELFLKHILVRIGYVIGILVFGLTIFEYLNLIPQNNAPSQGIPYGTLAFWGVWILVFAFLEHYLVPKPAVPPVSPEIKKQYHLYIGTILMLAVVELGLSMITVQKWNSGSDEWMMPLMGLSMIIAVITMVVLIRYVIFTMDIRERNRKAMAAAGSVLPQREQGVKEKDP
jgi:uncharacterized membrane protein